MFARTPFAVTPSAALTLAGPRVADMGGRANGYPGATPSGLNSKPVGCLTPNPTRQLSRQQEEAVMRDFINHPAAVTPVELVAAIEARAAWLGGSDSNGADPHSAASSRRLDRI